MKTIYGRPVCPACLRLKTELTKAGTPFKYITVIDDGAPLPPGGYVTRSQFQTLYPDVRSFPFVVEAVDG